jgi:hypothetical protein
MEATGMKAMAVHLDLVWMWNPTCLTFLVNKMPHACHVNLETMFENNQDYNFNSNSQDPNFFSISHIPLAKQPMNVLDILKNKVSCIDLGSKRKLALKVSIFYARPNIHI